MGLATGELGGGVDISVLMSMLFGRWAGELFLRRTTGGLLRGLEFCSKAALLMAMLPKGLWCWFILLGRGSMAA